MKNHLHNFFSKIIRRNPAVLPRKSKAQSLTEFAITLPVLFILLSGVVEYGFALNYYLSLLDATREAARFYSNSDPFLRDTNRNIVGDNTLFYGGAAGVLVSLLGTFNLSVFLLEAAWIAVSVYGIARSFKEKRTEAR